MGISFKPITTMISELLQECAAVVARNLNTGDIPEGMAKIAQTVLTDAQAVLTEQPAESSAEFHPEESTLPNLTHEEITVAKPNYDRLVRGGSNVGEPFEPDVLPQLPQATPEQAAVPQNLPSTTLPALLNQAVIAPPVLNFERRNDPTPEAGGARYDEQSSRQQSGENSEEDDTEEKVEELTEADLLQRVRRQNLTGI